MSRYRKIDTRIWNDEKFRGLSDPAKIVFFMLLTHPSMTALGAMRASVAGLSEELGWEVEAFHKAFTQVLTKGMAEHDPKACLISLSNFIKYNPPESPNVVKAWVGATDLLPECELKNLVISRACDIVKGMSEGFIKALPEAFLKTLPKSMPYQEQEQEQENNSISNEILVGSETPDSKSDISQSKKLQCPHQDIIAIYHEVLPTCPAIREWTQARAEHLRARWNEDPRRQNLDYWRKFFVYVGKCDFLVGKSGSKPFFASLDWIVKSENFTKIREERYANR